MQTPVEDSGYRGNAIYQNYKVRCYSCDAERTVYWLYAHDDIRKEMESGKFQRRMHNCPACVVKEGAHETCRVTRKLSAYEAHKRLNLHKRPSYIPTHDEISAHIEEEQMNDSMLAYEQDKVSWAKQKGYMSKTLY